MYDILQLNDMLVPELKELGDKLGLGNVKKLSKQELIYKILDQQAVLSKNSVVEESKPNDESKKKAKKPNVPLVNKTDSPVVKKKRYRLKKNQNLQLSNLKRSNQKNRNPNGRDRELLKYLKK